MTRYGPEIDPRLTGKHGFKNFLCLAWEAIGLPEPTPIQLDMADWLQHGPSKLGCEGMRGIGKSYITAAFADWCGLIDPSTTITVVSASKGLSDDFATFALQILQALGDLTAHLLPQEHQRRSKIAFDFGCAPPSRSASISSRGIFSSNTGGRADIVICDDIVSWANSQTQAMRDKLAATAAEFDGAILKPGGRMIYLYTMQTESDPAHGLPERDYKIRYFPAEVPNEDLREFYGDRLCPYVRGLYDSGVPAGTPTEPTRFPADELLQRRLAYGNSMYRLQYLLDHRVADEDRYPLKVSDLIVDHLHDDVAYEKYLHCRDPEFEVRDLVCVGRTGDRLYRPLERAGDVRPYDGTVMFVDPSGRGTDETAVSVVSALAGTLFVKEVVGLRGGYGDEVLQRIASLAQRHKVTKLLTESNLGGGMFTELLKPHLRRAGVQCEIEEVHSSVQKERRIADTLEPLMNQHRVVVDRRVIERDHRSVQDLPTEKQKDYQLIYQLSRLTREKGCLRHDDRLDSLAGACAAWVEIMSLDADTVIARRRDRERDDHLEQALKPNGILNAGKRDRRGARSPGGRRGYSASFACPRPGERH